MTEAEREKLTSVDERGKSNTHRIDKIEKRLDDTEKLVTTVAIIAEKQNSMDGDIKDIKGDVKKILEKPAKRWDGVIDKIVLTVAAAIVAFALAKIGL